MTEEIKEVRRLASIRKVSKIEPIEGADFIVMATVDDWKLVTAIDNGIQEGDLVVYFEIDSWIPTAIAPFLSKGAKPRVMNDVEGERLRTIKLKGQISQGLIIPVFSLLEELGGEQIVRGLLEMGEGTDLTELLNIQKWEKAIPANLSGQMKRYFPPFIKKTDQERAQNIGKYIFGDWVDNKYEATLKLDGSSMTAYHNTIKGFTEDNTPIETTELGVCSRNLDLKIDQEGNSFVDFAKNSKLLYALEKANLDVAVQGELMGEGIQGNRENLKGHHFYVYDIWDITNQKYLSIEDRKNFFLTHLQGLENIHHVPLVGEYGTLESFGVKNMAELLEFVEGKSITHPIREGVVFKSQDGSVSFKAISNTFLAKEK